MNSVLRPNYRRARELKSELEDLRLDYEDAEKEGAFSRAADIREVIHETEAALWMTGVTSEYDL